MKLLLSHWGICIIVILTVAAGMRAQASYDDLNYSKGTFFGGANNDSYLLHVAVDKAGNIYGCGFGRDIPTSANAYQRVCNGPYDIVVFKLDPTMTQMIWSTYIGGSNVEAAGSIAVNDAGEVYLSGYTLSPNFPTSVLSDTTYLATGVVNYFVTKLSADGSQLLYSRILGNGAMVQQQSASASKGAQIAIDASDNAYVLAHTNSSNYNISSTAYQQTKSAGRDLVFSKLGATGNILYSTFIGGNGEDYAGEIVYAQGKLYCTGYTGSSDFPTATNKIPDAQDAFIMCIENGPVPFPSKSYILGGSSLEQGISLCYDAHADRLCMTGVTFSSDFPSRFTFLNGESSGGFIVAFSRSLSQIDYASILGPGIVPTSIVAQPNSAVFISGFASGNVPLSTNAFSSALRGQLDGVLFSVDSLGTGLRYGTYIGGSRQDYSTAKVLMYQKDCTLRVIFGITTHSPDFPSSSDSYQPLKLNGTEDQPALVLFSKLTVDPQLTTSSKKCSAEMSFEIRVPCAPVGVQWNFGDGSEEVGFGPVKHSFSHNGTFNVKTTLIYPEPDTVVMWRQVVVSHVPDSVHTQKYVYACVKDTLVRLQAFNCARYSWSPGTDFLDSTTQFPVLRKIKNSKYYVRGWDANGCESIDSVQVYTISVQAKVQRDTIICQGSKVRIVATGGSSYRWFPSTGLDRSDRSTVVASPQNTTKYQVIVTDGSCTDTAYVRIEVETPKRLKISPLVTLCPNATAQLGQELRADSSFVRYYWLPVDGLSDASIANPIVTAIKTMQYTLIAVSAHGCVSRDSILVKVSNSIKAEVSADTTVCESQVVQLHASGGSEYRWEPADDLDNASAPTPICRPQTNRVYKVFVMSGHCIDSQQVRVSLQAAPTVKLAGDTVCCSGDIVQLRVENPDSELRYTWRSADSSDFNDSTNVVLKPTHDEVYIIRATNSTGCFAEDSLRVHVRNSLLLDAKGDTTMCVGGTATLRHSGMADVVQWQPNDGYVDTQRGLYIVRPFKSTSYFIQGSKGGCIGFDTVHVEILDTPGLAFEPTASVCKGNAAELRLQNPQSGVQYRWEPAELLLRADSSATITLPLGQTTTFRCRATRLSCEYVDSLVVQVLQASQLDISSDTTICQDGVASIRLSTQGLRNVQWIPKSGLSTDNESLVLASPQHLTRYSIIASDSNGCVDSANITVGVEENHLINLSVNSIEADAGALVDIVVTARCDTTLVSSLEFELRLDKNIFLSTSSEVKVVAQEQYFSMQLPPMLVSTTVREVARLRGIVLASAQSSSLLDLRNVRTDAHLCSRVNTSPGIISTSTCAGSLRGVRIGSELRAIAYPQPARDELMLSVVADEGSRLTAEVFDLLGQSRFVSCLEQHLSKEEHVLNINHLEQGEYFLNLRGSTQSLSLRFVKLP